MLNINMSAGVQETKAGQCDIVIWAHVANSCCVYWSADAKGWHEAIMWADVEDISCAYQ